MYTYIDTCRKSKNNGHIANKCKNNPSNAKLNDQQEQSMINAYRNTHNTSPVLPT